MKAVIEKHPEIKRFINISDTHFGVRSNSNEWMEIQKSYFYDFFIPLIKKNYQKGDAIIHTGDVFDSRQSLNLKVMNMAMDIFQEISKIMPVFIICGNHDIYHKKTNDINSVKIFNWLDNVYVYEKPTILKINNNKTDCLLMPWCDTHEQEQEIIDNNPADYLFCHTDMQGLKFNPYVKIDEGLEVNSYRSFKMVYSGHIHYAQRNKNIRMVGSPYQMTRSDIGNQKHVWYINFTDDTEHGIPNNHSPNFIKIKLEKALEMKVGDLKELFENNFVDVLVNSSWTSSFPFNSFIDLFSDIKYRKLNYVITTIGNSDEIDLEDGEFSENVNIEELIETYIDNLEFKDKIKIKLKERSKQLYKKSLTSNENEGLIG